MRKFFIMVSDPDGKGISPIIQENENVMVFNSYDSAEKFAEDHAACMAFGYEIFCYG